MQGEKGMSSRFLDISSCNSCAEPDERSPPVMTRLACVEAMTRRQFGICLEVLCRLQRCLFLLSFPEVVTVTRQKAQEASTFIPILCSDFE